jgi:hypothetical protein
MSDNEFLKKTGRAAGASAGFVWGAAAGVGLASVFFPPAIVLGGALGGILGQTKGKELGEENPEAAIVAASVTAFTTGGVSTLI